MLTIAALAGHWLCAPVGWGAKSYWTFRESYIVAWRPVDEPKSPASAEHFRIDGEFVELGSKETVLDQMRVTFLNRDKIEMNEESFIRYGERAAVPGDARIHVICKRLKA